MKFNKKWIGYIVGTILVAVGSYFGLNLPGPQVPNDPPLIPQEVAQEIRDDIAVARQEQPAPLLICGRTESITERHGEAATEKPWPVKRITWTVKLKGYTGLTEADTIEAFKVAWASWASGVDIEPVYVNSEADALVRSNFGRIDGASRVLAWSELSNGTMTPKHQLYDTSEVWDPKSKRPTNRVGLIHVASHEIGHVLGLVHDGQNAGTLMQPTYNPTIPEPTPRDITRLINLGYAPAKKGTPVPEPGPAPTPSPEGSISLKISAKDLIDSLNQAGYEVKPKPKN